MHTFGKCIIKSTTQIEKDQLIQWMFIAVSDHQILKSVVDLSEGVKTTADKQTAKIVMRLFTVACKTELKDAVKFEGQNAVRDAFELLGKVSMGALMTDQNVQKAMGRYVKFMDLENAKFENMEKAIKDGTIHSYSGPIYNQAGELVVPAGQNADDGMLAGMSFYVQGIDDELPQ